MLPLISRGMLGIALSDVYQFACLVITQFVDTFQLQSNYAMKATTGDMVFLKDSSYLLEH